MNVIDTYKLRCYGLSKDQEVTYGQRSSVRSHGRGDFEMVISTDRTVTSREASDR